VRRFRLKFVFASKRNEAKRAPFRFVFACSSENSGPIFSLVFEAKRNEKHNFFASFRFEFFASKQNEKHNFFALQIISSLHFLQSQVCEYLYTVYTESSFVDQHFFYTAQAPGCRSGARKEMQDFGGAGAVT
jgi:hypothetical protein